MMEKPVVTSLVVAGLLMTTTMMFGELSGFTGFRCQFDTIECCGSTHINFDRELLYKNLHKYIYGQHIAINKVYEAITDHYEKNAGKALVLSFHGWTGTGKNYVSKRLVESIYERGSKSSFVHIFNAEMDFPDKSQLNHYQNKLHNLVVGNVSRCGHAAFIFDEADHMPSGLVDTLLPFIQRGTFEGKDYSRTIFIFLSNVGSKGFAEQLLDIYKRGDDRSSIHMQDVEKNLFRRAFFEENGYRDSDLVSTKGNVDVFVPFFPLEREHVHLCIRDAIEEIDPNRVNDTHLYTEILKHLHWIPPQSITQFSSSGCKKLKQKVRTMIVNPPEAREDL